MITKSAQKDKEKIKQYPALKRNVQNLLELISENPFQNPTAYWKFETMLFTQNKFSAQTCLYGL